MCLAFNVDIRLVFFPSLYWIDWNLWGPNWTLWKLRITSWNETLKVGFLATGNCLKWFFCCWNVTFIGSPFSGNLPWLKMSECTLLCRSTVLLNFPNSCLFHLHVFSNLCLCYQILDPTHQNGLMYLCRTSLNQALYCLFHFCSLTKFRYKLFKDRY